METISVLIPTYNRAGMVTAALYSIYAQTHRHLVVIVYDDGSTDETLTALREFPRVEVIGNNSHRGVSFARNALLDACQTKYATWQDSDDVSNHYRIERQVAMIEQTNAPIVYTNWEYFRNGTMPNLAESEPYNHNIEATSLGGSLFDIERCSDIRFNERITMGGEDLIWRKAVEKQAGAPSFLLECRYYIRQHNDRVSRNKLRVQNRAEREQSDRAYFEAVERLT